MTGELILRLFAAALMGGAIGLEREYRAKEAGLRTHFLVALGSALFMVISQFGFEHILDMHPLLNVRLDPSRIAAQVVSGIGFIGAGIIIFQKHVVKGLTTAAGIWAVSGVGMCFGNGVYIVAAAATLIMILLQYTLHDSFDHLEGSQLKECTVVLKDGEKHMDDFLEELRKSDPNLKVIMLTRETNGYITIKINMHPDNTEMYKDVWSFMKRYDYVISCNI